MCNEFYQINFDLVVKELRGKIKYIDRWKEAPEIEKVKEELRDAKENNTKALHEAKLEEIKRKKELLATEAASTATQSGGALILAVTRTFEEFDSLYFQLKGKALSTLEYIVNEMDIALSKIDMSDLLEEDRMILDEDRERASKYMRAAQNKMSALYNNSYTYMEIILDNEFIAQYILKLITYGLLVGALMISDRLFSEMYMQSVYGKGENAPNLIIFVGMFIGISAAFSLFLLTVLVLLSYMFKNDSNSFIINKHLIKYFVVDYIIATVIIALFSIIIASIIQQKRYFRYRTEGLRSVRALREIVMSISAIIILVPFFVMF
jgi:hypothetical protein